MTLRTLKAYALKELTELFRTRLVIMVYLMPTLLLIVFGYGIRMDVTHARVIIIDNDHSKLSFELCSKFEHSKYFNTTISQMSEARALSKIKDAQADIVIIIPSSFEKRIMGGLGSEVGVFIDGAFPDRASTMASYVQGVIINAQKQMGVPQKSRAGITLDYRTLFNQAMRDQDAIVPGLIGLVLLVAPAILAALLIVKEKERGTIFNFYASSLSRFEFILAKLLPAFLLHSINIFILFLIAVYLFHVPFRGSFTLYWFASELYILISLGIGMLISVVTKKQIVAIVLTVIITILPGFLYSGMLMPISSMQKESYVEAHLFPVMYYNHIIYDTFLIGQGLHSAKVVLYLAILLLFLIIFLSSSIVLLKKEIRP
jgi:ABC-2 type transport system permease protein